MCSPTTSSTRVTKVVFTQRDSPVSIESSNITQNHRLRGITPEVITPSRRRPQPLPTSSVFNPCSAVPTHMALWLAGRPTASTLCIIIQQRFPHLTLGRVGIIALPITTEQRRTISSPQSDFLRPRAYHINWSSFINRCVFGHSAVQWSCKVVQPNSMCALCRS